MGCPHTEVRKRLPNAFKMHAFSKDLLKTNHLPGTMLLIGDVAVNKDPVLSELTVEHNRLQ
jgi:hypothetical protein